MWLLLPRGGARDVRRAVLAVVALGLGASQMPLLGRLGHQSVFTILAVITVVAAAATVSFRKPVYCAIWFGLTLLGVAGLFLLTGAQFLAVATIVVYAGAILVTFLFVLMLASQEGKTIYDRVSWEALISAATGMVMVGVLSMTIGSVFCTPPQSDARRISVPSAGKVGSRRAFSISCRQFWDGTFRPAFDCDRSRRHIAFGRHCRRGGDCRPKPKGSGVRVQGVSRPDIPDRKARTPNRKIVVIRDSII